MYHKLYGIKQELMAVGCSQKYSIREIKILLIKFPQNAFCRERFQDKLITKRAVSVN